MLKISLPRGDIRNVNFTVKSGETTYSDFTEIYFTVKKSTTNKIMLFQKRLTDGTIRQNDDAYTLRIEPEDTDKLEYGVYAFDIEVIKGDVIKQTTIGELTITPEVTFSSNE